MSVFSCHNISKYLTVTINTNTNLYFENKKNLTYLFTCVVNFSIK